MKKTKAASKGFNLVEAAIVLGVVGLVIGGIWVAAASVSAKNRLDQTVTGLMQFSSFFKQTLPPALTPGSTAIDGTNMLNLITRGMTLPAGWSIQSGFLYSPLGVAYQYGIGCGQCPVMMSIYTDSVASCMNLARTLFGALANPNSAFVRVGLFDADANGGWNTTAPSTLPDCSTGTQPYTVELEFSR